MKPSEIRSRKLRAFKNCILKTCIKSKPESELRAIVKNWKRADDSLKSELDAVLTGLIAEGLLEKDALGYHTTNKAEEVAQYAQALSKFKVWLRQLPNLTVIQEQMQQWSYEWTPDNPIALQMLVTANSLLNGLQFVQSSDAVKLELIEMAINKKRAERRLPPLTLTPAPEAPAPPLADIDKTILTQLNSMAYSDVKLAKATSLPLPTLKRRIGPKSELRKTGKIKYKRNVGYYDPKYPPSNDLQ